MFIGREKELESLQDRYESDRFEFVVMRGRRRVGKSTLLKEFCKNKKDVISFTAQERNKGKNLIQLSYVVNEYLNVGKSVYVDFDTLFEEIFKKSINTRIILILDEFPYLANSDKSLMSMLQNMIDKYKKESKLFLILCGSSISFMEKKVLAYKAPLYGRSTGQMLIRPFFFNVSQKFFENYNNIDKVITYSIFGGIPAYLETINSKKSLKENVIKALINTDGYLYDEPNTLIKQELREPAVYNSVIEAIADGASTPNVIATKIYEQKDKVAVYLKKLIELQIIKREYPITEKWSTYKSLYSINDNLFKFWYKFISENKSKIEFDDDKNRIYDKLIEPFLNDYVGKIFEDICMEYFLLNIGNYDDKLPFSFDKIGRWWGNNPKEKREEEIDFIAFTGAKAAFGECKWHNAIIGEEVLNDLVRKSELFPAFKEKLYVLFSKAGYTDALKSRAACDNRILLIGLDEMFL